MPADTGSALSRPGACPRLSKIHTYCSEPELNPVATGLPIEMGENGGKQRRENANAQALKSVLLYLYSCGMICKPTRKRKHLATCHMPNLGYRTCLHTPPHVVPEIRTQSSTVRSPMAPSHHSGSINPKRLSTGKYLSVRPSQIVSHLHSQPDTAFLFTLCPRRYSWSTSLLWLFSAAAMYSLLDGTQTLQR